MSQLSPEQHQALDMKLLDIKFLNHHDSQSEYSESESRYDDEMKPLKLSNNRPSKSSKSEANMNCSSSSPNNFSSTSMAMASHHHLYPEEESNSSRNSQNMLPPPKIISSFSTPSQVPTSLLSIASPSSLNSPGSGRDTPLTTPPLPNCSGSSSGGKRANRTRFTDYQIKVLQEFFENNAYPKDDDLEYLSKLLGLSPRVIVVWFQNARQKARKGKILTKKAIVEKLIIIYI